MSQPILTAAAAAALILTSCVPPPDVPPPRFSPRPPYAPQPVDPYGGQPDPYGTSPDPYGRQPDSYGRQPDPYGTSPDPYGQTPNPPSKHPAQSTRPGDYPTARKTANPKEVISPYEPYNVIDVEGFRSGQLARDPSNQKIFRVP